MKKFIFSAIAAIGLLLSPSCSDDNEALNGSGNEALVSFSVNLADGIQTKASDYTISDGKTAKNLFVRVFEDDGNGSVGNEISTLAKNDVQMEDDLTKEVDFALVKGKTYHFLFWAQAYTSGETGAPYSFNGHTVKVSYEGAVANDEKRDAFYAVKTKTVTGSFQEDVELHRPFAQLNFLTTAEDIKAAINAGQRVDKTSIKISSAAQILTPPSSFDPDENPSASDAKQDVSFGFAKVPFTVSGETVSSDSKVYIDENGATVSSTTSGATEYFYLATTYFLVNNTSDATAQVLLNKVNMKVEGAEGDGLSVQSVPVRMNYRTNIYGNLLTSTGKFNVSIEADFNNPDNNEKVEEQTVQTEAAAAAAFVAGASKVTLTEELTSSESSAGIIPQTYANRNTDVIELVLEQSVSSDYVFKYRAADNNQTDHYAPAVVHITIPESAGGSTAISESNIQLAQSTVYVNGVKVTTMTAETAQNTLVVGPGTVIETLKVKAGNVRIMNGGKVTEIKRHNEADANKPTYVTIVTGGVLATIPTDPNIIITYEDATKGNVVLNGVYSFNTVKEAVAYAASKNISDVKLVLAEGDYQEAVSIPNNTTVSIEPASGLSANDVKFNGQLASLGNGVLNVKNITISHNPTIDLTGISQTGASAIALWGAAVVNCEDVTFENFANNATAITSWWSTGAGTQINVKNSTFNCGGQRPIRSDANVTVEGCTFTDPYRYAVQMTSKSSTMTAENAVVNFKNNTINAGTASTKNVVYGIQLEGETYGCSHLIINGSGNTINVGETGKTSAMYYCECGLVDHTTIQWNVEVEPEHGNAIHVNSGEEFKNAMIALENENEKNSYIILDNDIDLQNVAWTPLSTKAAFVLDGQGHTISNLTVTAPVAQSGFTNAAMIGENKKSAMFKNLTIDKATITGTEADNYHGAVLIATAVATPKAGVLIDNVKITNSTVSENDRSGLFLAYLYFTGNTQIRNSSTESCTINSKGTAGALLGYNNGNDFTAVNCSVSNTEVYSSEGANKAGVLIGSWSKSANLTLSNCTAVDSVAGEDQNTDTHTRNIGREVQ